MKVSKHIYTFNSLRTLTIRDSNTTLKLKNIEMFIISHKLLFNNLTIIIQGLLFNNHTTTI
jgi:hypothetical protein